MFVASNPGKMKMVNLTLNKLITRGILSSGLILLAAQTGCSLPAGKPVPTYPGLSSHSPYQTNYPPTGQVYYGAPISGTPNTPAYGQWNQPVAQPGTQSGGLQSFIPLGFTGQTC